MQQEITEFETGIKQWAFCGALIFFCFKVEIIKRMLVKLKERRDLWQNMIGKPSKLNI
jgi:hypothetical protein